ncbi:MAG: DUF368 domain-containing protein [Lachnospiraceae bacterium]|nr:DUF368 domain-containing protein [Lachnospiraceae bacterium]
MVFLKDMVKGMFIGIANIIPGVSGGTIALSMGIYDKLIGAVSNFLKDWKKSVLTLLPILIGCGIGLIGFTFAIEYLLSEHTFVTCMTFIGLILGGLPVLIRQLGKKLRARGGGIGASGILAFLILFAFAILLPLMGSDQEVLKTLNPTPGLILIMFLIGIIASATMVIPGVSGSLVLMILGYYYGIIESIKGFLEALKALDIPALTHGFLILAPFGIGILLGIFLIAKLITFLFEKYGVQTYCAILGLILSSPFAIFYNTGLFGQLHQLNLKLILSGILLAIVGAAVTYFLGEKE